MTPDTMFRPLTLVVLIQFSAWAADGAVIEQARLALASTDSNRIDRLESAVREARPGERAAIFGMLADHTNPGCDAVLDIGLNDRDPAVRAATMGAIAKNWPTDVRHLAIMRRELDSLDPQIAQAAMGAIAVIGDDRETGKILTRMEAGGPIAAQAHATMVRIYGSDLGDEVADWRAGVEARQKLISPLIEHAAIVFHGQDNDAIRAALHQLLMLRNPPRSDVADVIAPLLEHPDPIIAALAHEGLGNLGGGVARLAIKTGGPVFDNGMPMIANRRPVFAGQALRKPPTAGEDHTALYAFFSLLMLAIVTLLVILRTPLKNTKPVRQATAMFKRKVIETREFKRATAVLKKRVIDTREFSQMKKATQSITKSFLKRNTGRKRSNVSDTTHGALEPKSTAEKAESVFRKSG